MKAIEVHDIGKKYRKGKAVHNDLRSYLMGGFSLSRKSKIGGNSEFWALNDISFTVEQGEALGIIGPNGSGKSTLLKILSQITTPTKGRAKMMGRVSSLLEVGTGFHPELTGRENIYLNGAILGMKRLEIRSHMDEIIDFSEIEEFIDTPVKHYSSGMYLRLAFSVAAHLRANTLLLDEILSVGDNAFRTKCMNKMHDSNHESGRTVLFVSHNMNDVLSVCDRCISLKRGTIVKIGPSNEVVTSYLRSGEKLYIQENHIIDDIHIINSNENDSIYAGESIDIKVFFNISVSIALLYLRIEVVNAYGIVLGICNNRLSGTRLEITNESRICVCQLVNTPFISGDYYVNISLYDDGEEIFNQQKAKMFKVNEVPSFSKKREPIDKRGVLLNYSMYVEKFESTNI